MSHILVEWRCIFGCMIFRGVNILTHFSLMQLTLAAQHLHPERGVEMPGLDMEPEESSSHWVFKVGNLNQV